MTTRYIINQNPGGDIIFRTTANGTVFKDALIIDGYTGTFSLPEGSTALTKPAGDSSTAIATTAFVTSAVNTKANINSPIFTGTPSLPSTTIAVTQPVGNNSTAIATTEFVVGTLSTKANLDSPNFTGTPILPIGTQAFTQTAGTSNTTVATTAFVTAADNLKANLASPAFTGTPSLPSGTVAVTQTAGTSNTTIATTAFVTAADNLKANLASPAFTGTPSLPSATIAVTQSTGDSSTKIATTAFVASSISTKANVASPSFTGLITSTGAASSTLSGQADPSASTSLTGTNTLFQSELVVGDKITINSETRTIVTITNNIQLTVDRAFSDTALSTIQRNPAILLVKTSDGAIAGNIDYQGSWSVGAPATGNANGTRHTINGGLQSGNTTSTDQSSILYISNNFFFGSTASSSRTNSTTGGSAILLDNRTSNTSEAVAILTNQPGDGLTTTAVRIASATHQGIWTFGNTSGSVGPHLIYGGARHKQVATRPETATIVMEEKDTTPASPTAGSEVKMYMKADKLVLQYNDAGTIRYKYLDLAGSSVTWVHTTTAP